MKVQNNICEGSLITNYLPADYCDSFLKTIVSDKVVTPEVLTILQESDILVRKGGRRYFPFADPLQ